jgi:hypothetical protein
MSSIINYVADGSTNTFQIPFTYISQSHVVVTVDGVSVTPTFINDTQLSVSPTPTTGLIVIVKRVTPVVALVDFTDGSTLFEADLDLAHQQNRFIAEESRDRSDNAIATLNANITNINTVAASNAAVTSVSSNIASVNDVSTNMAEVLLADTNAATATTKAGEASASASTASTQAGISTTKAGESAASAAAALASKNAAATSETNASSSETNALASKDSATTSASTATTQAGIATTQAGISTTKASEAAASAASITGAEANSSASATAAAGSASAASGSATSAANSAASAATALDNFEDKYLGSLASEPTTDLDGNALVSGALYFSQSSSAMQVYDGANWIAASSAGVASLNLFEYTATAGQTTFSGTDDNGLAMSFIAGNNIFALNGIILDPSDFNDTSGTSVVLADAAVVGDLLNAYCFKSFTVADTVSASGGGTFSGNVTVNGTLTATTFSPDFAAQIADVEALALAGM